MATATSTNPDVPAGTGRPAFVPLEANPELLTSLTRKLGLSSALAFHDIFSLSDPSLLAYVPRPALALLLVFPVSAAYESHRLAEDALRDEYQGKGEAEPVVWVKQTIRNACGLMGVLHGVLNGPARGFIEQDTTLSKLLAKLTPQTPAERSQTLEQTPELASAHHEAATAGDTEAPDAEANIDLHYVCFVKTDDGRLWEMDGRRKGPIDCGVLAEDEDVLSEKSLTLGPRKFIEREGSDPRFSCVALAGSMD